MKNLAVFVGFVAVATFAVMEYMNVRSLTQELDSLKTAAGAASAPAPAPAPAQPIHVDTRMVCPLCKGEKVVMLGRVPYRKVQNCPVCGGIGYRMLVIPADMAICPDCQGMGVVYWGNPDAGEAVQTSPCVRCNMTGLIAHLNSYVLGK